MRVGTAAPALPAAVVDVAARVAMEPADVADCCADAVAAQATTTAASATSSERVAEAVGTVGFALLIDGSVFGQKAQRMTLYDTKAFYAR